MLDRFTDLAKRVMNIARQESQRLRHEYLAPEHILLGLSNVPDSFGARVLQALNVGPEQVRAEVEKMIEPGTPGFTFGRMPFTASAKGVLEQSMEEACKLGHNHIGTEHLLLGMFKPGASHIAGDVLSRLGLTAHAVREIVKAHPGIDEDAGPVRL